MARKRIHTFLAAGRDADGFTLIEVGVVCAIIGVLAVLAFPSIRRFNSAQETKSGATKLAGLLEDARSRAVSEATPHLVYVNDPGADSGGGTGCGPMAVVVRDSDRSYTITDGDRVREFSLPSESCDKVKLYAQDDSAEPYADLRLPARTSRC
jgi:prepilin-type N-terminal cleavage/methylation domain-containing protein